MLLFQFNESEELYHFTNNLKYLLFNEKKPLAVHLKSSILERILSGNAIYM